MNTKNVLLSTVLTIALTLPMVGQHAHEGKANMDMKKHSMSKMMGKPTADATVEGLHMKVWLMTQKQHKKMMKGKMAHMMMDKDMKGMKHDGMEMTDSSKEMQEHMKGMKHGGMGMNKAKMDSIMAGTHCIMLDVTDAASKEELSEAEAKVMIVTPSKKHSSVDLNPMMSHFGSGLTLEEKGKYQFTVNVIVGGITKTIPFSYVVK